MNEDLDRRFGVELNNATWNTLAAGGPAGDATDDERERFLYGAYASAFHWMRTSSATPANRVRGEHLVARAAIAVGLPDAGLRHARRCLELCELHPDAIEDWDLAFAEEATARALAAVGDVAAAREHLARATRLGTEIADDDDREVFFEEFGREPWFGLDPTGS
jgi:hypothetical protein